ncbi:MAG: HAD family phosphatase [Oscillospiraceae bacterium]|nr:HAD family phosphatase [Oscillospiraceae bacterium]
MLYDLFPPHTAAIFDLDGTLIDSMWVWHRVDALFFAVRGIRMPEDYPLAVQTFTFAETAAYTVERFGLTESPRQIMDEWNEASSNLYRDEVKMKAGAKEYLLWLKSRGVKLGTATSLTTHVMQSVLAGNGVIDLFDALTSGDEVPRGKAYPDIFLLAAQKLQTEPAQCVAFDDIAKAMRGIKAAGMTACAVHEPESHQDWDEMQRLADICVRGFA